jgi:hypothetical protein
MTNNQKNLLAMAVGLLLILFMLLVFPATGRGESPCPDVPAGYLTPAHLFGTGWEVVDLQQDQTYGFYWFFLKNKDVNSKVRYANLITAPGVDWPIFYNYLENGGLRFLRLTGDRTKYIVDPDVQADDYNAVAKYYQQFFGVFVAPRTGA